MKTKMFFDFLTILLKEDNLSQEAIALLREYVAHDRHLALSQDIREILENYDKKEKTKELCL